MLIPSVLYCAVLSHGPRRSWDKPPTPPNVVASDFFYELEGESYQGYYAFPRFPTLSEPGDGNRMGMRTGVLVGHTWLGLGDMEKYRAEQLAAEGYVSFAVDVYGVGIRPTNEKDAEAAMNKVLANVTSFHERLQYGLRLLTSMKEGPAVNVSGLAANGYCFGGVMVLELARLGAPGLVGVSSFHGELANLTTQANDKVAAAVQVHHADLDFQGPTALLSFEDEMRSQNVTVWSTTKYGNCAHGWTDPTGQSYMPFQAVQAHNNMFAFYNELGLAPPPPSTTPTPCA